MCSPPVYCRGYAHDHADPKIGFVIGWDQEITVQLEGVYVDCPDHLAWISACARPGSAPAISMPPQQIVEFD
jgi:hypothetical protein